MGEQVSAERECLLGLKSEDTDVVGSNEAWMKLTSSKLKEIMMAQNGT